MAVTAQQVLNMASALMDQIDDVGNFEIDPVFDAKTLSVLTILQAELIPPTEFPEMITDLSQDLLVDDRIALQVLPYGLAAHLVMNDNQALASFLNARYDELKHRSYDTPEPIETVYGGFL